MIMNMKKYGISISLSVFILFLFYIEQQMILFSPDVSYLLHATKQWMNGGKYGVEIFETNPPMILMLYAPSVWLSKWIGFTSVMSLRIYVIFILFLSAALSYFFLKECDVIKHHNNFLIVYAAMILSLLVLPMIAFGQREHLWFAGLLPYLLSVVAGRQRGWIMALFGIYLGMVFSLKPYFLIPLCLIEAYVIFEKRHLFAWVRIETLVMISVMVGYLFYISLKQPGYWSEVYPFIDAYYFEKIKIPWLKVFLNPITLFLTAMIVWQYGFVKDKFQSVFFIGLIGATLAFLIPQNNWYYHAYPAIAIACILAVYSSRSYNWFIFAIMLIGLMQYWFKLCMLYENVPAKLPGEMVAAIIQNTSESKDVTCFSVVGTVSCFPWVMQHQGLQYQSRFPSFWWYDHAKIKEAGQRHLIRMVASDLKSYHTSWVVVDKRVEISMLNDLLEEPAFAAEWNHYDFYANVYHFDIYKRQG